MACLGATGSTCTGIETGEDCVIKTSTVLTDVVVETSNITGTTFNILWDSGTSHPLETIRLHLRDVDTTDGYEPLDIEIVSRDSGTASFEVVLGNRYYLWLRAETATEHGGWFFGTFLAEEGSLEVPNSVLWQGDTIEYNGEPVVYRSSTGSNFFNIYALEG